MSRLQLRADIRENRPNLLVPPDDERWPGDPRLQEIPGKKKRKAA